MNEVALLQMIDQPFSARGVAAVVARVVFGLLIAFAVYRLVSRMPWPQPFRLRFVLLHLIAAPASGLAWLLLSSAATVLLLGNPFMPTLMDIPEEFLLFGTVSYAIIAGISYAEQTSARLARAEAAAAQTRLAALRAQLQPHFLFNALHTVVQLIPADPDRAIEAAEHVAAMLRTTMDDDREVVSLLEEWAFVSRYLELESIRFGDRLRVSADLDPEVLDERVPTFSLQTLVENAVRHGAAPRVEPTEIVVTATTTGSRLTLTVRNSGDGESGEPGSNGAGAGTGLKRLHARLTNLYSGAARLRHGPRPEGGYEAVLVLPREALAER